MAQATWNGQVIANSDEFEMVENNVYFPRSAIKSEFFKESAHTTICSWKGVAHYFDVVVNGKTNANAAWYYPEPKEAAKNITGYVAFWKGVEVTK
ncbi:DUF427 domain-containing protein [Methyloradius palustris]|uniref:DUF427 domain-containing protein n=1 Tax=Methyloradius palustris TaxID=2778876 RepID=A0A8D5G5W8_9PROT|nr:DUF427 domain-containing protein [Methyloradius palustris]BCM23752.1 hypothetical protein ZMTM_00110 [Methyloradius palustris]